MIGNKKVLAIIPARSGSKGLPGKNVRMLLDKPLLAWPISAAKDSKYIDKIIVSTDSESIAKVARKYGAEIPFLRPEEYSLDESTSYEFISHALNFFKLKKEEFDYLVLLEPTSPLTEGIDLDEGLDKLYNNRDKAKSLVGVVENLAFHPDFCVKISDLFIIPFQDKDFIVKRRQDLEKVYSFEGSMYIADVEHYLEKKTFYHDKTLPFIFPEYKSFEIDSLIDFYCIEAIAKNIKEIKSKK